MPQDWAKGKSEHVEDVTGVSVDAASDKRGLDTVHDVEGEDININKTLRKMDTRLIPIVTILYLLSFLDRGNIGNAKILGMSKDLSLVGNQYNLVLMVFFFPYAAFEIPSNLLLKKLRPSAS